MKIFEKYQIIDDWICFKLSQYNLKIKAISESSIRVIASPRSDFIPNDLDYDPQDYTKPEIVVEEDGITIINAKLKVIFNGNKLLYYNNNNLILEEVSLKQSNVRRTLGIDEHIPIPNLPTSSLNIDPYEFIEQANGIIRSRLRFKGDRNEKIYGMGGFQEEKLNKNNDFIELIHRNSQTAIPIYISDKNYGFIWNNFSVGSVFFGDNEKVWEASDSDVIDYTIFVGDNPKELIEKLTSIIGRPGIMDSSLLGLWQSKLRYQTKEELETVYDEYIKRKVIPSVMVIDYFHWTEEGDYKFDYKYWSGIKDLSQRMLNNGTKLMVSLWPTVSIDSENYKYLKDNNLLINSEINDGKLFNDKYIIDFTKYESQRFLQNKIVNNYIKNGVSLFWADQAEPEMNYYNHFIYVMNDDRMSKIANSYPLHYVKTINSVSAELPILIRSAFVSSQKYGALLWSGDIESSFESMKKQIRFALSVGVCGQSWWTSDIGGFHSGNSDSDYFKELMIRWFQFSVFSPILRMHGDRQPHFPKIGDSGGGVRTSGSSNEIFSFGKEVELILIEYVTLRNELESYIETLFIEASQKGWPLMRTMFFEYPHIDKCYDERFQYFFGSDLLICPVVNYGDRQMEVFIPDSGWVDPYTGYEVEMGYNTVDCPLYKIPVFLRKSSANYDDLILKFKIIGGKLSEFGFSKN